MSTWASGRRCLQSWSSERCVAPPVTLALDDEALETILARRPLGTENEAELRKEHFDGDFPIELEVAGKVDGGHRAVTELALDHVVVRYGGF